MIKHLLVSMGVVFLLISICPVSAASNAGVANDSLQYVIDQSHVKDGGTGSGPMTADDGSGAIKPTITFPSDTGTIAGESRQGEMRALPNASAKATPSTNGTAPRTAGAAIPLVLGALAIVLAARRSR